MIAINHNRVRFSTNVSTSLNTILSWLNWYFTQSIFGGFFCIYNSNVYLFSKWLTMLEQSRKLGCKKKIGIRNLYTEGETHTWILIVHYLRSLRVFFKMELYRSFQWGKRMGGIAFETFREQRRTISVFWKNTAGVGRQGKIWWKGLGQMRDSKEKIHSEAWSEKSSER